VRYPADHSTFAIEIGIYGWVYYAPFSVRERTQNAVKADRLSVRQLDRGPGQDGNPVLPLVGPRLVLATNYQVRRALPGAHPVNGDGTKLHLSAVGLHLEIRYSL